jgi:hypothetical protein
VNHAIKTKKQAILSLHRQTEVFVFQRGKPSNSPAWSALFAGRGIRGGLLKDP